MARQQTMDEALAAHIAGRREEAERICRDLLQGEPRHPGALHLLAAIANSERRFEPALELARMAIAAGPEVADFRNTVGIILAALGRSDEAERAFRDALRLRPAYFEGRRHLAALLAMSGRLAESAEQYREAIRLRPSERNVYEELIAVLYEQVNPDAAIACRREMVERFPDDAALHSKLLVELHHTPALGPQALFAEHLRWVHRHAGAMRARIHQPTTEDTAERRLRIGYLSPDFRDHPARRFFEPLLRHHDRDGFEIFCYADVQRPDSVTERLRRYGHAWRDVAGLSDDAVVQLIERDRIDVLVDLAGHMNNRRLLLMARNAAPVRVSYIGYPDTTGMRTVGYRLTDDQHDPPGITDAFHTETLIRLLGCCWCYEPDEDAPAVNELPSPRAGSVTLASLNRVSKVTPDMLRLWGRLLGAVPESRLMVLVGNGFNRGPGIFDAVARGGIDPRRVTRVGRGTRAEYLARYNEVDIALDTHPYAGMTTTCDAMWMGVPTVTLAGNTHVSRTGVSLLSAVGLPELIARTPEEYVEIAVGLATDLPRLALLRSGLRERMRQSPLCDGPRLAREVEAAYRGMWREWCAGKGALARSSE